MYLFSYFSFTWKLFLWFCESSSFLDISKNGFKHGNKANEIFQKYAYKWSKKTKSHSVELRRSKLSVIVWSAEWKFVIIFVVDDFLFSPSHSLVTRIFQAFCQDQHLLSIDEKSLKIWKKGKKKRTKSTLYCIFTMKIRDDDVIHSVYWRWKYEEKYLRRR